MNSKKIIIKNISEHLRILKKDRINMIEKVQIFSNKIIDCFDNDGKILVFGNGGSAADAQHFATELTVRIKKNRIALPALSLTTDSRALTAIGNDFSFNKIFKRQLEALSKSNDLVVPITTSGNSSNIFEALKFSKSKKLKTFGILGNNGGKVKKFCEDNFIVSSNNPSRVQEIHIIFWQTACEIVENYYASSKI